jgi:hypothetical protein
MDKREKDFWNHKLSEEEEREFLEHGQEGDKASEAYRSYISEYNRQSRLPENFEADFYARVSKPSRPKWLDWAMKIAAGVLLATALGYAWFQTEQETQQPALAEDTYQDPREAFEETKKILLLVSAKMNEANEYTVQVGKFNEAKETIKN